MLKDLLPCCKHSFLTNSMHETKRITSFNRKGYIWHNSPMFLNAILPFATSCCVWCNVFANYWIGRRNVRGVRYHTKLSWHFRQLYLIMLTVHDLASVRARWRGQSESNEHTMTAKLLSLLFRFYSKMFLNP